MPTIIYPSPVDFRWMYQRPQQLLYQMSLLGYLCIFINPAMHIKQSSPVEKINDNLFIVVRECNINFDILPRPIILVESYPPQYKANKTIPRDISIFDCLDYPGEQFEHWKSNFDEISSESDIILCSADKLYEYQEKFKDKCHIVKNGADFQYFKRAETIPKNEVKQIGFIGSVAPWLDYEIIDYIAKTNEDKKFIFIGDFYEIGDPIKRNNIVYLGRKDYFTLIDDMAKMDLFIMPFKVTTMTNCVSPIKLFEYLSTGKPIISTPIHEVKSLDRSFVYVANDKEEFSNLIELALEEKNKKIGRQVYAYFNSWRFRAEKIDEIIKTVCKEKYI